MSHNPPNANGNGSFTPMNALVTVGDALVAAAAKAQAIGALRPRITFGETGEEKGLGMSTLNGPWSHSSRYIEMDALSSYAGIGRSQRFPSPPKT